jgi:hypothetical protein
MLEWVKWQAITAAIFLLNGSIYACIYPYATVFPTGLTSKLSMDSMYLSIGSVPLGAIVGLLAFLPILAVEGGFVFADYDSKTFSFVKAVLYFATGLLSMTTLTNVQPGIFLIFSSMCLMFDVYSKRQSALPT